MTSITIVAFRAWPRPLVGRDEIGRWIVEYGSEEELDTKAEALGRSVDADELDGLVIPLFCVTA